MLPIYHFFNCTWCLMHYCVFVSTFTRHCCAESYTRQCEWEIWLFIEFESIEGCNSWILNLFFFSSLVQSTIRLPAIIMRSSNDFFYAIDFLFHLWKRCVDKSHNKKIIITSELYKKFIWIDIKINWAAIKLLSVKKSA